jgi:hypothetical protein
MAAHVTLEPLGDRPAWNVRVEGQRVGLVFRERREFRGVPEGSSDPLPARFTSREAAARALARRGGFEELDRRIVEVGDRRERQRRSRSG